MFYTEKHQLRISDYDRDGNISYEAILQILETAGSHHSYSAGDSVIEGSQSGIALILTDWRVQIIRRINSQEELNITTWVRGKAPASRVFRNFFLTDSNGNEVIRAEAKFALLDLSTGRLTRISEALLESYQPENKTIFDTETQRPHAPTEFDDEQIIILRKSDIDFNGHVHNTRYMDFALEILPKAFYRNNNIAEIHIVYMKLLKESSAVTAKCSNAENKYRICIYSNDVLCTLCEFITEAI